MPGHFLQSQSHSPYFLGTKPTVIFISGWVWTAELNLVALSSLLQEKGLLKALWLIGASADGVMLLMHGNID